MVKYYEQYSQLIFLSVTTRVYVGFLNYELSLVLTIFHAFLVESAGSSIGEWNQYHKVIRLFRHHSLNSATTHNHF